MDFLPLVAPTLAALPKVARQLWQCIESAGLPVLAFEGEMGAGKTTLIRALSAVIGIADDVSSPTFSLVNEYRDQQQQPVYHFDFYRIGSIDEALRMGAAEYLNSGYLCLVEWPARVAELLPVPHLQVNIEVAADESRTIHLLFIN